MTLSEPEVLEWIEESTEAYRRRKHQKAVENRELAQTESDFHEIILEQDPYSALRFFRK